MGQRVKPLSRKVIAYRPGKILLKLTRAFSDEWNVPLSKAAKHLAILGYLDLDPRLHQHLVELSTDCPREWRHESFCWAAIKFDERMNRA